MSDDYITAKLGFFDDKVMLWTIDKFYTGKISVCRNDNRLFVRTFDTSDNKKIPNAELDMLVEKLRNNEVYSKYDEISQFIAVTGYDKAHISFEWTTKDGVDTYDIVAKVDVGLYKYLDILKDCTILKVGGTCGCQVLNLSHCKYFKRIEGIFRGLSDICTNKIIFPSDIDVGLSKLTLTIKGVPELELVGNNKIIVSDSLIKYTNITGEFKELLISSGSKLTGCNITGTVTVDIDAINKLKKDENISSYSKIISSCNIMELQLKINGEFIKYNNVSGLEMENNSYTIYFLDGKVIKEQI